MPVKNEKQRIFYPVFFLVLLFLFFLSGILDAVRQALLLCGRSIIPSLFPFLVLSRLLTSAGPPPILPGGRLFSRLFGLPAEAFTALLIGALCGFPLGARVTADLYAASTLTKSEAESLSSFCNMIGPAFAVGAVGVSLFGSAGIGWLLYGIQLVSALVYGLLTVRRTKGTIVARPREKEKAEEEGVFTSLPSILSDSTVSVLGICGTVLFFSAVCALPRALLPEPAYALLAALLEVGNGASAAAALPLPLGLAIAMLALSFGGLSVFMQTAGILRQAGLSTGPAFRGKCIQALFSLILLLILLPIVLR